MRICAVYRCGPRTDRIIARRVCRRSAVALARRLNADPLAPLHYVMRSVPSARRRRGDLPVLGAGS